MQSKINNLLDHHTNGVSCHMVAVHLGDFGGGDWEHLFIDSFDLVVSTQVAKFCLTI